MRIVVKYIKNNYLILLFILFFLIRLPLLGQINLLHDERDIVLSGDSIAKTGKDLFGNTFPIRFENISPNNPLFAIYYSAIWSFINPVKSIFYARLPFVFISSLLIFFIYQIIYLITKDKNKSLATSIFFCFSPWVFHITRLALDIPLAIVFLAIGIIFYLKRKTLYSYIFFFLSIYTYQGFKLLIPFLLIYLELFFFLKDKKIFHFLKNNLLNIFFACLVIGSSLIVEPKVVQNRIKEIVFFDQESTTQEVIFRRNTSIAPKIIKPIFDNKITVAFDYVLTNLIKGQDFIYLFKEGDYSAINGNIASGQFLFIFMVFYYLGLISLGKASNKFDFYSAGFFLIGIIPSLLSSHGASFSIRGMLSALGFSYILALGFLYSKLLLSKKKFSNILRMIFIVIFIINVSYFLYIYFLRRPVLIGEIFNENERQLSKYILSHSSDKLTVYHQQPKELYLSLAFFDNNIDIKEVQKNLVNQSPYRWHDYQFLTCDNKINYRKLSNSIIAENCLDKKNYDYFNDKKNKMVKEKILFKDYSTKTAYFIIE